MGLGLAVATVGMDTMSGNVRLTFEIPELVKGISFLVAVIGLFGLGELLQTMEEGLRFEGIHAKISLREVLKTAITLPRHWVTLLRSALIGCWMGITPGGPTAASFMSYGLAKRFSRRKDGFGKGEPEPASSRPRPPTTPPAPARSCRCWRSASRGRPPPR